MGIAYNPATVTSGLVLALDAANTKSYAAPSPITGSFTFASNSRVRLPTNAALQFGSGNFTIQFWMRATTPQTTFATIVDASTNNQAIAIGVGTNLGGIAGRLSFSVFGGTGTLNSTTPVLDNTWRNIACVKSGNNGFLFVNGILEASTTNWSGVTNAFLSGGCLGGSAFGAGGNSDNFFAGSIANFAVYNTALYTANFAVPTQPPAVVPGLQLLYNVTSSAALLTDSSANNFTSTVASGTPAYSASSPLLPTTWSDLSGGGNNATMFGTVPYETDVTQCFNFATATGTFSSNVNMGFTFGNNMIPTTGDFTLSFWVKNMPAAVGQQGLFSNAGGADGYRYGIGLNAIYFLIAPAYTENSVSFSSTLSAAVWHNVVTIFSRNTLQIILYHNGVLQNTGSMPANQTAFSNNAPGLVRSPCCAIYTGKIGAAFAYNRALTATEINQNFQALRSRFGV